MGNRVVYGLYNDDGSLAYKGTTKELLEVFGITYKASFANYASKNQKFMRRYTVRVENPEEVVLSWKIKNEEEHYKYEYVLFNIKENGNSIVCKKNDVDEVVGYLKENGYDVKVREVHYKGDSPYWVFERV